VKNMENATEIQADEIEVTRTKLVALQEKEIDSFFPSLEPDRRLTLRELLLCEATIAQLEGLGKRERLEVKMATKGIHATLQEDFGINPDNDYFKGSGRCRSLYNFVGDEASLTTGMRLDAVLKDYGK
jgi:hypothetical protein